MMTQQEFIEKREQVSRTNKIRAILWLLAMFSMPVISLLAIAWIERQQYVTNLLALRLFIAVLPCASLAGFAYLLATANRRHSEKWGMICPGCRKPFGFVDWVLATGNCSRCGTRLVELEKPKEAGLLARMELAQRERHKKRRADRKAIPLIILIVLSLLAGLIYAILRRTRPEWDSVDPFAFGGLIAVTVVSAFTNAAAQGRLEKEFGLRCPHCKAGFQGRRRLQIILASGRCGCCGGPVLKEEASQSSGQIPKAEFVSRRRKFERRDTIAASLWIAVLFVLLSATLCVELFLKPRPDREHWEKVWSVFFEALLLGTILAPIVFLTLSQRILGVRCAHCHKQLFRCAEAVIATGNCGFCGERVVMD